MHSRRQCAYLVSNMPRYAAKRDSLVVTNAPMCLKVTKVYKMLHNRLAANEQSIVTQ